MGSVAEGELPCSAVCRGTEVTRPILCHMFPINIFLAASKNELV